MSPRVTILIAAAWLVLVAPAGRAQTTKTVPVDCTKGDSINKALEKDADVLIVEISGFCDEAVSVDRSHVTLRGRDPLLDGIHSSRSVPSPIALVLISAAYITIENLGLRGPLAGFAADLAYGVTFRNCRLESSGFEGGYVSSAWVLIEDSIVQGNPRNGIIVENGGRLTCVRCTIAADPADRDRLGVHVQQGSEARLFDSTVAGFETGLRVGGGSRAFVAGNSPAPGFSSRIEAVPGPSGSGAAIRAIGTASVVVSGTSIHGPLLLQQQSVAVLVNASQELNGFAAGNRVGEGSTLKVDGGSALAGDVSLVDFGKAVFKAGTSVWGSLVCGSGGDAFCDQPAASVAGSSNCAQCVKP